MTLRGFAVSRSAEIFHALRIRDPLVVLGRQRQASLERGHEAVDARTLQRLVEQAVAEGANLARGQQRDRLRHQRGRQVEAEDRGVLLGPAARLKVALVCCDGLGDGRRTPALDLADGVIAARQLARNLGRVPKTSGLSNRWRPRGRRRARTVEAKSRPPRRL